LIRLFVCDIDGCLAEPYRPFDLVGLGALAEHAARAGETPARPVVSLCSGRSYSYVEAMTQALGLTAPVLFESGGGLFDPSKARTSWHPDFTVEVSEQLDAVRQWMAAEVLPGTAMSLDYGKRTQAGLVGPRAEEITDAMPRVRRFVEARAPGLRAFATEVSVDVLAPRLTKKQGLAWLARRMDVPLAEVAYIGDSEGDVEALQNVGWALAPANAAPDVRRAVRDAGGYVCDARVLDGTLEAYRRCVARNEGALRVASPV
jgi:hydroxymethylpyrimidine pyrophosphatase-like HAD family hydrolase